MRRCWETAEREINGWLSQDTKYNTGDISGTVRDLVGAENWTSTKDDCLDIGDMEGVGYADELAAEEQAREEAEENEPEADMAVQVAAAHLGGQDNALVAAD